MVWGCAPSCGALCLRAMRGVVWCVYVGTGVGGFTGLVVFSFVPFLVRGSGLSTSVCVTSLYIDAAPQGGARHT